MKASLRPLEIGDLESVLKWVNDPEVIGNFQNFKMPISREDEKKYLEGLLASGNDKVFSIEAPNGEYIGQVGIHQIHWPSRNGRIALIIGNKEHWGEGYGQGALREILRLSFEQYNLHKVWLVVWEENQKARHIYEKAGFKTEGLLRDEYFHKGKYHNMLRMSVLEEDYRVMEK